MSRSTRKRDCEKPEGGEFITVPAGTPDWITPSLIERTIKVWRPYYAEVLSVEEAITMIQNAGRLFSALSSEASP